MCTGPAHLTPGALDTGLHRKVASPPLASDMSKSGSRGRGTPSFRWAGVVGGLGGPQPVNPGRPTALEVL